jgi:hypothetical protein
MKNHFTLLILIFVVSCQNETSLIRDNVSLELSTYQDSNMVKASALPVLKPGSELMPYERRFDFLLMNVPEIYHPDKAGERNAINRLYPDTNEVKRRYMDVYCSDQKLVDYFQQTYAPIKDPDMKRNTTYTVDELMEAASKFFYCDEVFPDTTIQSHICIGVNGFNETKWQKDYTLLSAFCFEAIFNDLDKDSSQIRSTYIAEKETSCMQFRTNITSLDQYFQDVKTDLFNRMKNNSTLKEKLLAYYDSNKNNLAFVIAH